MLEKPKNYINLYQPEINEYGNDHNYDKIFIWKTEKGNITLTLTISLQETTELGQFYLVTADINTYDIKGQGRFIWNYLTNQLELLAKEKRKKVLHQAQPNEYSEYLMANDYRYKKRKNGLYYALYQ